MFYAGFDRAECPPIATMRDLITRSNLKWCAMYLPAPSCAHGNSNSWRGKRQELAAMGWGLAPLYVGQQTVGPGSHVVTAAQGAVDGLQAANDMNTEGFPPGSWVYLDLENGPPFGNAQREYVAAWIDAVEAGGYHAGVYCSYLFAADAAKLRQGVRIWAFRIPTNERRSVGGLNFPAPDPTGSSPVAAIWQRQQNVALLDFGGLVVDLDVAAMRDPSASGIEVVAAAPAPESWWHRIAHFLGLAA